MGKNIVITIFIHLNHGPLDKWSAFRFENFMQQVKADVRKPGNILAQIFNRIAERENLPFCISRKQKEFTTKKKVGVPPLGCESPQYIQLEINGFKIGTSTLNDSCFGTKSKQIIRVECIATKFGRIVLIGRKFLKRAPFFTSPINSAELDIFKVSDYSPLKNFALEEIEQKYVIMPIKNDYFLVVPLIHSHIEEE